ncbi:MAG TPA: hypothetical protein PLM53_14355 [Spirochaetota bacterium]|nr:hypothetical protein [Spirochaetota bacterium]HPC41645.1 hypothetical protein [Spirochaetota bacterium]HPL16350.1 hypothetical protein [Spirochaetota bacterium]HQF09330.1 hypothetical protein [Spirochaetota bacterium]HQH98278.1 hypothetical protein [Spirochaetota bacterium]
MKKGSNIRPALLAVAFIFASTSVFPFSDQTTTERILKENKRFVEFVNVCVTNFADDKKEDLRKAYEKHFNADVAYLQSDYRRSFKRVYASQGEMERIYRELVKNYYLEDSKMILDRLAPGIIRSKSARARLYLTLGYRDRTVSWTHYTVGDASNPKLYSYKLYKYVDAIKMARRAKRFAFLALFESQTRETKKKIYNQLCKTERDMKNKYMNRFVDLNDQDYINEIEKSYSEAREEAEPPKEAGKDAEKAAFDSRVQSYEAKVVKRVRFRNETKTARYLLDGEFDRAEDIMREYIDDFNFKLILSTFEVLSASGKEAGAEEKAQADRYDYSKFRIHLMDNYARFSKPSMIDSILETLKVEDDVEEKSSEEGVSIDSLNKESGTVKGEKKDDRAETGDREKKEDIKEEKKLQ